MGPLVRGRRGQQLTFIHSFIHFVSYRVGPSLSRGLTARAPSAPTHTSTNTPTRTGVPPRVRTTMAVPKIPYIRRALDCIASVRVPLSPS